ncbi:endonuclease/exonuclease/phosphatase family protein [Streptomyces sp. S.PB5]|uniref:endonuclease/exonuclease/phosphatase family protein n=1 Tax=Streptomyces sp. S.PB5 TaxID=3020844 RepID=UPI0025B0F504|nr:endonuclease/exonuclease/phosphatase family protein [Streptomyces sp. S.PB5]MDN3021456.1 endonuclease/exonuclease/phosphatase family protein [Streptomyces sp. S.PB5]
MTQVNMAEAGQARQAAPAVDDTTPGTRPPDGSRRPDGSRQPGPWRRGPVFTAGALLLGLLLLLHRQLPNPAGLGSLVETFLPWFGLFVAPLLAGAVWRRSAAAAVALLLPVTVWLNLYGGLLTDKSHAGGDLTVVSHNVAAENPDPAGTARDLAASGADLLALEELTDDARGTYEEELAEAYPHHTVQGTVGLWSKLPLSGTRPVDVLRDMAGPLAEQLSPEDVPVDPPRALRTTVATEKGPLAVYVAHLGSVRVMPRGGFWTDSRDAGATKLAEAVAAEPSERVLVLGDFNGTLDDRAFDGLTSQLRSAQDMAGSGFGFSWPTEFPVARIDEILVRGVEPRSAWLLPATGSDHRPVAAGIGW